jgi:KaiC/GvpD/RAD55 family RecA-like ATPase
MSNSDEPIIDQWIYSMPYGNIADKLLDSIFIAMKFCYNNIDNLTINNSNYSEQNLNRELTEIYDWIAKEIPFSSGKDKHLISGFQKKALPSRISKITINALKKSLSQDEFYLPSPLFILYQFLGVPEFPQSYSFALIVCRSLIFKRFKINLDRNLNIPKWTNIFEQDIGEIVNTFRNYYQIRDIAPFTEKSPAGISVAHFLAMKGYFLLRFGSKGRKNVIKREYRLKELLNYLESKNINGIPEDKSLYEFRLSNEYVDIPDAPEIINEFFGVPLPIRGCDTIFFNGLNTLNKKSGLVMSISGKAGTGKTSLALAIASNLSPFHTKCNYISFEEDTESLEFRINSITPNYLKKLSIYNSDIKKWFRAVKLEIPKNKIDEVNLYLDEIYRIIIERQITNSVPINNIFPLIIVIDSINGMITENSQSYAELEAFIQKLKKFNALIMLISGDKVPQNIKMDYLVDIEINLKYSDVNNLMVKPQRIFELRKTRNQISRPGSHIFHLSGSSGFRIAPQLPSQLDKRNIIKRPLPEFKSIIPILNIWGPKDNIIKGKYLNLYQRSQILIHGSGSSGKAGLGLKILMTPSIYSDEYELFNKKRFDKFDKDIYKQNILIISFLYPDNYYKHLRELILTFNNKIYPNLLKPSLDYMTFYPGFLSPEDLIDKISRKLDSGIQNGEPFTGILIDGLHNVSLQFKNLQERPMVWPMLYSMILKYKLTVVTTFTTFNIEDTNKISEYDKKLILQGQLPLLHVLVQATDFYLNLESKQNIEGNIKINNDEKKIPNRYFLNVKSAINQNLPVFNLEWRRNELFLINNEIQLGMFD